MEARATVPAALVATLVAGTMTLLGGCGSAGKRAPEIERDTAVTAPRPAAKPAVAAASPAPTVRPSARGGAYYQDDGPGDNPPPDLDRIPDAEPKVEPLRRAANNPYTVFGQQYVPFKELAPYKASGVGSWYGRKFHGQRTSSGEPYDMYGMTAAHATLPIPSYVRVTNPANGRSVIVRVNDRGPFHSGRIIDLSYTAAYKLGYAGAGSARVEVESILPEDMPLLAARRRQVQVASQPDPIATMAQTGPVEEPAAEVRPVAQAGSIQSRPLEEEPPKPPIPIDADASGIYLQLGAFSGRDNAESFRSHIYRQLGWLNDAVQVYSRDGMFRLHLGPYRDRAEANNMADKIREALAVKPMIVVR